MGLIKEMEQAFADAS